jgi:hypothetical protein
MSLLRRILLLLIVLIPLATLVHRDDLGRWDPQRSAMAGPDEFSYLLMAEHFLQGGGLSLKAWLGRDTFYPPGFPLLLAGWTRLFWGGHLTAFCAHALNATLLCADTLVAYLFARRMIRMLLVRKEEAADEARARWNISEGTGELLALLVAGLFATNWHVLECSLLIMSEPAFMLASFAWLALALRWPDWPRSPAQAAAVGALAVVAWSMRGAGIVCVAATVLYAVGSLGCTLLMLRRRGAREGLSIAGRAGAIAIVVLLAAGYQGAIAQFSPEKSVAAGEESANSYPRQLIHGLTDGGRLRLTDPRDFRGLALNVGTLVMGHFDDYASSFVPWPRENPDLHFRDIVGKLMGFFGLLGLLWQVTSGWGRRVQDRAPNGLRFLELYVVLYIGLYLVWPFHFARFWSPILPLMLVYGALALVRFSRPRAGWLGKTGWGAAGAVAALALLLVLSAEEDWLQLGSYGRRLNYVSDALAGGVQAIVKRSPDPAQTTILAMNGDDHFALAWYFSDIAGRTGKSYIVESPQPHVAAKGGAGERVEELVLRKLQRQDAGGRQGDRKVYLYSYFAHGDAQGVLSNVARMAPQVMEREEVRKIYQKEIIAAVWEFEQKQRGNGVASIASVRGGE